MVKDYINTIEMTIDKTCKVYPFLDKETSAIPIQKMTGKTISNPNALCECYKRYYTAQSGGLLPVFRGTRQVGGGFGGILSFLRKVAPFVMPVLGKAFSSFMSSSADGMREGKSIKDSVKGAITPALKTGVDAAVQQFSSQKGSGRRIHRSSKKKRTESRKKRVYKGRSYSGEPPSKRAKRSKDTISNLISNF